MADTPDPAREVLRDMNYVELIECAHRWRTERAEYRRLWNAAADRNEGAEAARDQALAERDALRAEVESLRAAPGCGEKVRALVELSLRWLNAYPQRSFWSSEHAREFYDLMRTFPKDADLAAPALPDHVRECVEACIACSEVLAPLPKMWDENEESHWQRCRAAGRAARAKGGA